MRPACDSLSPSPSRASPPCLSMVSLGTASLLERAKPRGNDIAHSKMSFAMDLFEPHAVGVAFLNAGAAFEDPAAAAQWWGAVHHQAAESLPVQAPSKPRFDHA